MKDEKLATTQPDLKRINLETARAAQASEVGYRTEKRWKIFSWASSLLFGSIAGSVALTKVQLGCSERILLCVAVLVLSAYTILWLDFNQRSLRAALSNLEVIDKELNTYESIELVQENIPFWLRIISYGTTVALLAMVTIIMILLPCQ